jgi:hypothetical protein
MVHSIFLSSANEFAALRVQSNLARGIFQQVVILPRLTYRLYFLRGRIEEIKSELEVRCSFSLFIMYHAWSITCLSWRLTENCWKMPLWRALLTQWC